MSRLLVALSLALMAPACALPDPCAGLSGTCVTLTVSSTRVSRVDTIQIVASGAVTGSHNTAANATQALPVKVAVQLPANATGAIHLQVNGSTAGSVVASGATNGNVVAGKHTTLSVDIEPGTISTSDMAENQRDLAATGSMEDMSMPANGSHDMAKNPPPPDMYKPVWHVENSGAGTTDLYGVGGSGATDLYVVGSAGTILHRGNNGVWAAQTSGFPNANLRGVWESPGGFVYVVGIIDTGPYGIILFSKGLGTWAQQSVSGQPNIAGLFAVSGTADNDISAVGGIGWLLHTTGGSGVNWVLLAIPGTPQNSLNGVGGSSLTGRTYACGEAGLCVTHADGTNVTVIPNTMTSTQQNLNSTAVTAGGELYADGLGGTMIRMTPAGVFSPVNTHVAVDLNGVSATAGEAYAVGPAATILRSVAGGAWASDAANVAVGTVIPANDLYGLWQAPNGEVFAVGKSGTVLHRY